MRSLFAYFFILVLCIAHVTAVLEKNKDDNYNISLSELQEYSYVYVKIKEPSSIYDCSGICQLLEFGFCGHEKPKFTLKDKGVFLNFLDLPISREYRVVPAKSDANSIYEFFNSEYCYCQRNSTEKLEYLERAQDFIDLLNDTIIQLEEHAENARNTVSLPGYYRLLINNTVERLRVLANDFMSFAKQKLNNESFNFTDRVSGALIDVDAPLNIIKIEMIDYLQTKRNQKESLKEKKADRFWPPWFYTSEIDYQIDTAEAQMNESKDFLRKLAWLQFNINEIKALKSFVYGNTTDYTHYTCPGGPLIDKKYLELNKNLRYYSAEKTNLDSIENEPPFIFIKEAKNKRLSCTKACDFFSFDFYNTSDSLYQFLMPIFPIFYYANINFKERAIIHLMQYDMNKLSEPSENVECYCRRRDFKNWFKNSFSYDLAVLFLDYSSKIDELIMGLEAEECSSLESSFNYTDGALSVTIDQAECNFMRGHLAFQKFLFEKVAKAVRNSSLIEVLDVLLVAESSYIKNRFSKTEAIYLNNDPNESKLQTNNEGYYIQKTRNIIEEYKRLMNQYLKFKDALLRLTKNFPKETPFSNLTVSDLIEKSNV